MGGEELVGPAPKGWKYKSLGAACRDGGGDIQTGPFGSQLHASDYVPIGIPSIMPQNIGDNRIIEDGIARITPKDARRLSRYLVRAGDIVYSRRGDVERRALVRRHEEGWLCGTGCIRVRLGDNGADPRYASYYLGHPVVREWIVRHAHGATMPNLNTSILAACPFLEPPIAEQRAIAHILGTLDDKIELNRRMNETLEAMARALFTAWFVDFEPVRAKMEGRWQRGQSLPGLPAHLYDLFPDRLVPSELGEIPEGWEVGSFGSFISQRSERVGARDVVVLSAVANGKLVRSDDHFKKRVYSKDTGKYLLVEQWDFAYNPSRINIGSIGMLEEDLVGGVSPVYVVVRPAPAYRWFLQFSIRRLHTKKWIETLASGSVRQSLSYSDFASIPCVVPPEEVVQEFDRRWSTWREGVCLRETETRTLAQLRDTLLPKLISGELRVKDAETFLERVAT